MLLSGKRGKRVLILITLAAFLLTMAECVLSAYTLISAIRLQNVRFGRIGFTALLSGLLMLGYMGGVRRRHPLTGLVAAIGVYSLFLMQNTVLMYETACSRFSLILSLISFILLLAVCGLLHCKRLPHILAGVLFVCEAVLALLLPAQLRTSWVQELNPVFCSLAAGRFTLSYSLALCSYLLYRQKLKGIQEVQE